MNTGTPKKLIEKIIAFDFGTKKIGVAVGQLITLTASPLKTISAKDGKPDWQIIANLIQQWLPDAIVVGLPLNMDGTEQEITHKVYKFITQLETKYHLPVFKIDERLTTVSVKTDIFEHHGYQGLKKAPIDSLAATLMLEHWMKNYQKQNKTT